MMARIASGGAALFGALLVVQGLLVGAFPVLAPSRSPAINWVVAALAVLALVAGPALAFGGRLGRIVAAAVCLAHWVAGLVLALLVASSASYLYGIYGHHGRSLGAIALVIVAVVMIVFWLIPGHALHFLGKNRGAGRRGEAAAPAGEGAR